MRAPPTLSKMLCSPADGALRVESVQDGYEVGPSSPLPRREGQRIGRLRARAENRWASPAGAHSARLHQQAQSRRVAPFHRRLPSGQCSLGSLGITSRRAWRAARV